MIKEWVNDIRLKTKNMTGEQKAEYVLNYYWYHILLAALLIGLLALLVYHISCGNHKKDFSLIFVNQEVDFSRDKNIAEALACCMGINDKNILVDSDYLISYDNVNLEGVNESSYEKFFFNWSAGILDAIVMPESFLSYCKEQNGNVMDLTKLLDKEKGNLQKEDMVWNHGKAEGIYLNQTKLGEQLKLSQEDPIILVFPENGTHKKACKKFVDFVFGE